MTTSKTISDVMRDHPNLTYYGFGVQSSHSPVCKGATLEDEYMQARAKLSSATDEINACIKWITDRRERASINYDIGTSYKIKHKVEAESGMYIANGSLIAAGLICGRKYRMAGGKNSPNCWFAIGVKH